MAMGDPWESRVLVGGKGGGGMHENLVKNSRV